jgi:hypothetical protein
MKETFYFSHDYHSRSDEKILRVRAKYGARGYGTFWMLVEIMAESSLPHIQLRDIPAIAVSINEDVKWLKEFIDFCIDEAKLFLCDGELFTSQRMIKHKTFRENFRIKGQEGAAKRWGHDSPPNAPPNSPPNAKERKGKDIKGKDIKIKYLEFVLLTPEEYTKLIVDFGQEGADDYIARLNDYIGSKGDKYKSHYHTILNWARQDKPKQGSKIVLTKQQQSNLRQLADLRKDVHNDK